ncbi:hypothetical protein EW026_g5931 [Hermanssonia centrifuga]|uniref:NACHT domain-containing protein n=1 Tax=Hermanssonia centrifuga TaxID=98765 RepID=A0A4S4KDJ9_9APHY|nr:hypothetical protein EW026_g5931 [Hermanssonia centrifuga]
MAKSVVSNVDARIDAYCEAFKALEEAFYKDRLLNMELTVARVLGAVRRLEIKADLSDILYSKGSALDDEDKACLEGTRVDILDIATNWAVSEPSSEDRRTVLLLVGTAGTGKSAIAHSMAQRFKKLGRLGSSFGFVRNVQERGVTYLFPTIARNMADFDEDIRQALWEAVGNDTALRTTHSLKQQFENFLQKPFEGITISGPILIVIDALDECGDSMAGQQLASLLATHSQKLPSNFRLFVTSRPEHHIISQFEHKDHIRIEHMESILSTSTSRDINLFIQSRLMKGMQTLDGIEMEHCSKLAITSQGLFQWASVACKQIANPPPGHTPLERYTEMVQSGSDIVKDQLLDYLYREVLRPLFADDDKGMDRFRAVLGVVLAAFEPLTMMAVKGLHASLNPNEGYEAKDVLKHLGSLLSGATEMDVPIRPLHTSFRDFLTDLGRSKDFFVDITPLHQGLLLASLNSMNNELAFNICRLDSSYVMNKDIVDLSDRIQKYIPHHLPYFCRFWAHHLDATLTTGMKMFPYQRFRELLKLFADKVILFWLEVLSILGGVSPAAPALATAARVLKSDRSPTLKDTLLDCIVDIQKFVDVFAQPMSQSAPHIYISAVPFSPRGSWISKQYLPRLPRTLRICNPPEDWPVAQGLIQHSAQIEDIAISTDGAQIAGVCRSIVISILVWDTRTGLVKYGPFETGGNVECIAFSADGAQIAYVLAENGDDWYMGDRKWEYPDNWSIRLRSWVDFRSYIFP